MAEIRKGLELEPFSPIMHSVMGILWAFRRNYGEALKAFQVAMELDPNLPFALAYLGEIYCRQGKYEEAIALVQKSATVSPPGSRWGTGLLAYCFGQWGKRAEAERILKEMQSLSERTYVPAFSFAMAYLGIGEIELVFHWLNRACDERAGSLCWLHLEPLYDPIRRDPRFGELAQRVGLPDLPPR
jgi:tetratricopeptide (TPR) repeat protein